MSLKVWISGTTDLKDQGVSITNWINHGTSIATNGKLGKCLNFNGSSNYLIDDSNAFNKSTWTICAWVYTKSTSGNQCILCTRKGIGYGISVFFIGSVLRIDCGTNNANCQWSTSYTVKTNEWFHLCIQSNGSSVSYYINGNLMETHVITSDVTSYSQYTSIGASHANNSSLGNYLNGMLNDVRIYDNALTSREIKNISQGLVLHYTLSSPTENTIFNNILDENSAYNFRLAKKDSVKYKTAFDSIVGGSVVWNQLVENGDFSNGTTGWTGTKYVNLSVTNGWMSLTSSTSSNRTWGVYTNVDIKAGHKYIVLGYVRRDYTGTDGDARITNILLSNSQSENNEKPVALSTPDGTAGTVFPLNHIFVPEYDHTLMYVITSGSVSVSSAGVAFFSIKNIQLVDLTIMFGSIVADYIYNLENTTAGAGAAWFKKYFNKTYYDHNIGTLKSIEGLLSHDTIGFNQLPEPPIYNTSNFSFNKNKCVKVLKNEQYEFLFDKIGSATSWRINIKIWDMNENLIEDTNVSNIFSSSTGGYYYNSGYHAYLMGNNGSVKTVRFTFNNDYYVCIFFALGDTSNSMIMEGACFHLVNDGTRNGEYKAYVKHSYILDNSIILRGIPKINENGNLYYDGDIYNADGTVNRRYREIDFDGSEGWTLQSINSNGIANFMLDFGVNNKYTNGEHAVCNRFTVQNTLIADTTEEGFLLSALQYVYIRISSSKANTVTGFKTWLASNPTQIMFELATPTIETANPYINPQIVDDFGTEEYIYSDTAFPIPVGHMTKYIEKQISERNGMTFEDYMESIGVNNGIEYDVSGYQYNGTQIGTFTYSEDTPKYRVSTQFNGTDNGILISDIQLSNIINTAVTYSFWIKPSGENGARSVYFGSYSGNSWSIEKTAGNLIRGYWNGNPDVVYSGATITDNTWQHICITKNGTSDIKVYINGILKATSTTAHNNISFPTTYRIGRDTRSGDGTPYKGLMSDFRIYATALSADEVKYLYDGGDAS